MRMSARSVPSISFASMSASVQIVPSVKWNSSTGRPPSPSLTRSVSPASSRVRTRSVPSRVTDSESGAMVSSKTTLSMAPTKPAALSMMVSVP